jgi:all-trans-nonaprenyl-diphosphate synthase
VKNGILAQDNYLSSGLPPPKFRLFQSSSEVLMNQSQVKIWLQDTFRELSSVDPYKNVSENLSQIQKSVLHIVGSDVPILSRVASYLFEVHGKRMRPAIVLLVSKALGTDVCAKQQRLSEITEMLHTASLLHDDVIDDANLRRGIESANSKFGNKLSILGGDFLLARASVELARLKNVEVVELLAIVLEHLVKGEILQTQVKGLNLSLLDIYLAKSFYKTASLIANSCKAVAILGGHNSELQDIVFEYGKHLGLLFQIVDDILDFESSSSKFGKPVLSDISNGIASAPLIFAADENPELHSMISRRFSGPNDKEQAITILQSTNGLQKARDLAWDHAGFAVAAAMRLPESKYRESLIRIVDLALHRKS